MKVTPLAPSMGAEITDIDLANYVDRSANQIDSAVMADIKAAWLEHQLIVIRRQDITPNSNYGLPNRLATRIFIHFCRAWMGFQ